MGRLPYRALARQQTERPGGSRGFHPLLLGCTMGLKATLLSFPINISTGLNVNKVLGIQFRALLHGP